MIKGGGRVYHSAICLFSLFMLICCKVWHTVLHSSPLAFISSLLSFLQLLQGSGKTLLSTIQLLLNQLDTPVKRGYITFSLGEVTEEPQWEGKNIKLQVRHFSNHIYRMCDHKLLMFTSKHKELPEKKRRSLAFRFLNWLLRKINAYIGKHMSPFKAYSDPAYTGNTVNQCERALHFTRKLSVSITLSENYWLISLYRTGQIYLSMGKIHELNQHGFLH